MYKQELIKPYSTQGEKNEQVEEMFDNISPAYDTLNHRLSWNIDKFWRKKAIRVLRKENPKTILDACTGTGDFSIMAANSFKNVKITASDFSQGMINIGKQKVAELGLDSIIAFQKEDILNLSYNDNSFDAVICAFGIRNFQSLDKGLEEMYRVLNKGGILCVLELTTPQTFPMKQLFRLYSHTVLPLYGKFISQDNNAYSYLTKTIEAFPQGNEMMRILQKAGFTNTSFTHLTFGICTLYIAHK